MDGVHQRHYRWYLQYGLHPRPQQHPHLYAGGTFDNAGSNSNADRIAYWDGGWRNLGSGIDNNAVYTIVFSGTHVYAGGSFTIPANRIAFWNGSSWNALGGGLGTGTTDAVYAITIVGNNVYAGGDFTGTPSRIARWDGSWNALGGGVDNTVSATLFLGGKLLVGGTFATAGGSPAPGLAEWDPVASSWSPVSNFAWNSSAITSVEALAVSGSDLYVGGLFTDAGRNNANDHVTRRSGTAFVPLGSKTVGPLNGNVETVVISGTDVYVGGRFTNAGNTPGADYIAKWNGTQWSALLSGTAGLTGTVYAIALRGSDVYVGGSFQNAGNNNDADFLARWDGSTWNPVGSATAINAKVRAIALSGNDVYVGGDFTGAGGAGGANYVARWNGTQWTPLLSNTFGVYNNVHTLALAPNGDVYIGGVFNDTGQNPFADKIARYSGSVVSPTVTAISLGFSSPITITSLPQPLSFLVTFSEPVTGVDAADFTVVVTPTTGLTTTIASVAGSSTSYIVNVSVTGAAPGSYTVGLNIPAGATITDLFNLPLGNLPFTGQTYQVNVPSTPVFKVYLSYIAR